MSTLVIVASLNYSYIANANYTALNYNLQQAENYYVTFYNQVISTEGYTNDKEIVLEGGERFQNYPRINKWGIEEIKYEATGLDVNVYSKVRFLELYVGEDFRNITDDESQKYIDVIGELT